jgi:hypothetical protein
MYNYFVFLCLQIIVHMYIRLMIYGNVPHLASIQQVAILSCLAQLLGSSLSGRINRGIARIVPPRQFITTNERNQ